MINTKHLNKIILTVSMVLVIGMLTACGAETGDTGASEDPAEDAITQALNEMAPPPTSTNDDPSRRTMTISRADEAPYDIADTGGMVSIAEPPILDIPTEDLDEDSEEELEEGTYSGNGTPYVFDVADSTVIAFGQFDKAMSDAIFSAINTYRLGGHLKPIQRNQSLDFCADCRAKEASYSFSHIRMNGTYWFTVAPAYYKAELMATDYATAQDTVDGWMQTATGRQYLLSEDLMSIGISVYNVDDRNFIICALGD